MNIWYLTDGKAGHVAQARGLFAALERAGVDVKVVELAVVDTKKFALFMYWISGARLGQLPLGLIQQDQPDLIVGVGHATHWLLILLQKCFKKSKSIVLMRPSLPLQWFDYAIIPAHDFSDQERIPSHVFTTQGALNPLVNQQRHEKNRHLILIGGASKRYDFSEEHLIAQIQALLANLSIQASSQTIVLTTSRRTPDTFLSHSFFQGQKDLQVFPVTETPAGWLFEQLHRAEFVWVTQDSVSMIFEALTAGCRVGVLTMPNLKIDRVTKAMDKMIDEGLCLSLNRFLQGRQWNEAQVFIDADHAADWLLRQLTIN
jgi:uncharacterized protein